MSSDKLYKKTESHAPDGGWGYVICVACSINIGTAVMFTNAFGLLFHDFMKTIEMENSTLILGFNNVFYAFAGFFTHSLLKTMSQRKLAILSAVIFDIGVIGTIFADSYATFFICQGFLMGVASGIMFNLSISILTEYFDKKRVLAASLVFTVLAVLKMLASLFVEWSMGYYGYRSTVILMAGISIQNLVASVLMQPAKWHRIVVSVQTRENKSLFDAEQKSSVVIKVNVTDVDLEMENNIGNGINMDEKNDNEFWNFIEKFVDIQFFKKFVCSGACIGTALAWSVEKVFSLVLPQALSSFGCEQDAIIVAQILYGGADLTMRMVMMMLSPWVLKLGSQETYLLGIALDIFMKFGLIISERTIFRHIFIFFMGISRCYIFVLLGLVVADAVPLKMFTQAMGISMLMIGLITIVLGPIIDATRELTKSYFTAFYLMTSFLAITLLFWSIEIYYKKNKHRRDARTLYVKSKNVGKGR